MPSAIHIIHVINSFEFGGAEAMLCNLVLNSDRDQFISSVVSLIDELTVAGPLLEAGVPVATMRMRPGVPDPRGVIRLMGHLRRQQPAVVHTWMDHSNLIGGIAARVATRARVVWGIHHSDHVAGVSKRSTLLTVGACARLSGRIPDRIAFCSEQSRRRYAERGFAPQTSLVIPNGFDTSAFRPDPAARAAVRRELRLDPNAILVGLVARYDPVKDHANFLNAAALLHKTHPHVHFLMCGANVDGANSRLVEQISALELGNCCHLLGPRRDIATIHAALDVATSSSISEAFPLVVGEAMACGVPCVATDVGDSALIVGEAGHIVPPRDPAALSAAWARILDLPDRLRRELGLAARRRVLERFDLKAIVRQYESLYRELTQSERQPGGERSLSPVMAGEVIS